METGQGEGSRPDLACYPVVPNNSFPYVFMIYQYLPPQTHFLFCLNVAPAKKSPEICLQTSY